MDPKRVYVTGFPSYTKHQDLMQVFDRYGNVKVEKISNNYAVVMFPDEDKAKEVIQQSGKIVNYGEFLTIKPYNGKLESLTPKREFPRSKQKETAIPPQQLQLDGDFHQQLEALLAAVRLDQRQVAALGALYADLQCALRTLWPGCVATPFGSITTGLGVKSSDADCFVALNEGAGAGVAGAVGAVGAGVAGAVGAGAVGAGAGEARAAEAVRRARRVLQRSPGTFAEVLAIPQANTPIVKLFHVPTATNCDVTFKSALGAHNSRLVALLLHADPRLVPLAVAVKYWAKVHGFSGSGKLTNYALTLLLLFYLQRPPALLPPVARLQADASRDMIVDHWNAGFDDRLERLPGSAAASSIADLLGGFFQFYSAFEFDKLVVSPLLGAPIPKDAFKDLALLPPELERYRRNVGSGLVPAMKFTTSMCVQDPFELCHNVASCVSSRLFEEIQAYIRFAAVAYEKDKVNDCRQFLKTILLQKPKIPRFKINTEFKAIIPANAIQSIENPDWEKVIRDVMLMMFKQLCKIELSESEDLKSEPSNENAEVKKRREKYTGVVTKAIWKRKQFSKLYRFNKLEFLEKQTRITEEILNAEKETLNLQFYLTLVFNSEKKANVSIKFKEGEAANFKDFGKFFIQIMNNWYKYLLRPDIKVREKTRLKDNKEPEERKINESIEEEAAVCDEEDISSTHELSKEDATSAHDSTTEGDTTTTRDAITEHTIRDGDDTKVPLA